MKTIEVDARVDFQTGCAVDAAFIQLGPAAAAMNKQFLILVATCIFLRALRIEARPYRGSVSIVGAAQLVLQKAQMQHRHS